MKIQVRTAFPLVFGAIGIAGVAFAQLPVWGEPEPVAMTGFSIAAQFGLPATATFDTDMRPRLNNFGDVVFPYRGTGSIGQPPHGLWANGANVLAQFPGSLAPNRPEGQVSVSDLGVVAWYGSPSSGTPGIYSFDLRSGSAALHGQAPGGSFTKHSPVVNNARQVAMWDSPSGIAAVARLDTTTNVGSVVPGLTNVSPGQRRLLDMNNAGQIAILDNRIGAGIKRINSDNTITTLASFGSVTLFPDVSINENGAVAFMRNFITTQLLVADGATTTVIATAGNGQAFSRLGGALSNPGFSPVVNDLGQVAFLGVPTGGTLGLYVSDGTSTQRIFGANDPIMTPVGLRMAEFAGVPMFDMNDRGDIAVHTYLIDPSNGSANDSVVVIRAVPAPGMVAMGVGCGLVMGVRRRRRVEALLSQHAARMGSDEES